MGDCGCGLAVCTCSLPFHRPVKRPFSQVDTNAALPPHDCGPPCVGSQPGGDAHTQGQHAGHGKTAGLAARLLARTASQPLALQASQQSGGSSGGAGDKPAAPPAGVQAVGKPGGAALRAGPGAKKPSTFMDVMSAKPPPGVHLASGGGTQGDGGALNTGLLQPSFLQLVMGTHFNLASQRSENAQPQAQLPGAVPGGMGSQDHIPATTCPPPPLPALADPAPQRPTSFEGVPPPDFSLKTAARFSSPHSFAWAAHPPAEAHAAGLATFMGAETCDSSNPQTRLCRALKSCVFPDAAWPADVCTALGRVDNGRELTQRRMRWSAALRCLYSQLRTCRCDMFYLVHPDGFTALFTAPGVRVDGAPTAGPGGCAWVTPTTRGLRQRMRRFGVQFTTPLAPDVDAGGTDSIEEELAEFERHNPGSTRGLYAPSRLPGGAGGGNTRGGATAAGTAGGLVDGTPRSVCVCAGTGPVHALFNFLHGHLPTDSSRDVPTLMAGVPFTWSSIIQLNMAVGTTTRQQSNGDVLGSAPVTNAGATMHRVHTATVTCSLPGGGAWAGSTSPSPGIAPWNIHRLLALFNESQDGAFSVRLDTFAPTAAFNLSASQPVCAVPRGGDDEDEADDGISNNLNAPKGAYGTPEERLAVRGASALGWPDAVCDALQCTGGVFTIPEAVKPTGGQTRAWPGRP